MMQKNRQNTADAHYLYNHINKFRLIAQKNELVPGYSDMVRQAAQNGQQLDSEKINFFESLQCLLFFAEKYFHELDRIDRRTEIQKIMQLAIRMANIVPDHKISARLYEHQGVLNSAWQNYPCAVRAFLKMKDVAEDVSDFETMMRAYLHLGRTLQVQCEYNKASVAFKCLLQIAWSTENFEYEMLAF